MSAALLLAALVATAPGSVAPPASRYVGFSAYRGATVPAAGVAAARLSDGSALILLPSDVKPPDGLTPLRGRGPWATGRVLIETRPGARAEAVAAASGLRFVRELGVGKWALLDAGTSGATHSALRWLRKDPRVVHAVGDVLRRLDVRSPFDDELYGLQWHLENTRQRPDLERMEAGADIHIRGPFEDGAFGSPDVVIAIVDSGHDPGHPDFLGKVVAPLDTLDLSTDDAAPEAGDVEAAHGIACAGLAAASREGTNGVVGVCPDCSVMPIRIFDPNGFTTDTAVVDAFAHARDNGAAVVSNSWGYGLEPVPLPVFAALDSLLASGRDGRGAVVLFAIGNTSEEVEPYEIAIDPRVFAVGGTGADDERVEYSTFGFGIDVVAPTGHDFGADDDGNPILIGPQLITTDRPGDDGYNPSIDDLIDPDRVGRSYTAVMSGTSGACPIAAGLAGLVLSAAPELGYAQVFAALRDGAEQVGGVMYDDVGWHPLFGHGRIDAAATLAAVNAGDVCAPSPEQCDNGRDDDCDGSVDGDDVECGFTPPRPVIPIGQACDPVDFDSCGAGFCFSVSPEETGACSTTCLGGPCDEGVCVDFGDADFGVPLCMLACTGDDDCNPGTLCTDTDDGRACVPACGDVDNFCPNGLTCRDPGGRCGGGEDPGEPEPEPDAVPEPGVEPEPLVDGGPAPYDPVRRRPGRVRIAAVSPCAQTVPGDGLWLGALLAAGWLARRRRSVSRRPRGG